MFTQPDEKIYLANMYVYVCCLICIVYDLAAYTKLIKKNELSQSIKFPNKKNIHLKHRFVNVKCKGCKSTEIIKII